MSIQQQLLFGYGQQSLIKSLQAFTITIATSSATGTATMGTVSTSNSVIVYGGQLNNDAATPSANIDICDVVLTNSTTITATRALSSATVTVTVVGYLVEFYPFAIKSIQRGEITLTAATSNTATITAVTTTNSALFYNGHYCTNAGTNPAVVEAYGVLTNSTTVTVTRTTGTANIVYSYTIVEFNTGILNSSTQAVTNVIGSGSASNTSTITSVNTAYTMVAWGNWTASSTTWASQSPRAQLTNGTTLTFNRTAATATTCTIACTVIEFLPQFINQVNRGTITLTTSSNNFATITSYNVNNVVPTYLGCTTTSANTANLIMADTIWSQNALKRISTSTGGNTTSLTSSYEATEFC